MCTTPSPLNQFRIDAPTIIHSKFCQQINQIVTKLSTMVSRSGLRTPFKGPKPGAFGDLRQSPGLHSLCTLSPRMKKILGTPLQSNDGLHVAFFPGKPYALQHHTNQYLLHVIFYWVMRKFRPFIYKKLHFDG